MGRIRVAVNRRVCPSLVLTVLSFVAVFSAVCAEAGDKLLLAHTPGVGYRTSVVAIGGPVDTSISLTDVVISGAQFTIPANTAVIAKGAGSAASGEFTLIDAPPVNIFSVVSNPSTSFVIPPFGAFSSASPSRVGPIVSDDEEGTWVTVFPKETTPVYVVTFDGAGKVVGTETFDAVPPVTQYRVKARVPVGFLGVSITRGTGGFECFPRDCASYAPVYGFATVSRPDSSNMRVLPFGH
jgi:hypothetical protein